MLNEQSSAAARLYEYCKSWKEVKIQIREGTREAEWETETASLVPSSALRINFLEPQSTDILKKSCSKLWFTMSIKTATSAKLNSWKE